MAKNETSIEIGGQSIRLSSPDKVLFPDTGTTKLDVARHYIGCGEGVLRGVLDRPCLLRRWPKGVAGRAFFHKRVEQFGWKEDAVDVAFPAAQPGRMPVVRSVADIVRMVQLGCIDLNPWPVRATDTDHPDELRLDLDPTEGVPFAAVRQVAATCREILAERELVGWPKTSGSRGIHVYVRVAPRWTFHEIRRAALAVAREAERRLPGVATTAWWKEERRGVFFDYNQNARDKTLASAYSLRSTGRVSTPFEWDELDTIDPNALTIEGFGARWAEKGDVHASIDEAVGSLDGLLAMVREDEARGLGDAPWPPHYPKQDGEPIRVAPSKRRRD